MKKRIIICGYPKSGNTWATRLVAEILSCPVTGFWCEPFNKEVANEGKDRKSDYECFKAHHNWESLRHTLNIYGNGKEKIIYIYRDPRAIANSASKFFSIMPKYRRLYSLLSAFPMGKGFYHKFLHRPDYICDVISKGLVHGTNEGAWLMEPWSKHVKSYIYKNNVLSISYESLINDPLSTSREMTDFLSVQRTDVELKNAVFKQSFDQKKKQLQKENGKSGTSILRKGKVDSWKTELPQQYIEYIEQNLNELMTTLGYSLTPSFK